MMHQSSAVVVSADMPSLSTHSSTTYPPISTLRTFLGGPHLMKKLFPVTSDTRGFSGSEGRGTGTLKVQIALSSLSPACKQFSLGCRPQRALK